MGMVKDNIERARRIYYAEQYRKIMRDAVPFLLNLDKVAYARELGTGGRIKLLANSVEYPKETMVLIETLTKRFFEILDPSLKIYIRHCNLGDDGVAMYYSVLREGTEYDLQIHLESFDEQKKPEITPEPDAGECCRKKMKKQVDWDLETQKEKGDAYP